jgi:hypothetical protein
MKDPKEVIARFEYAIAFAECDCTGEDTEWCEKCDLQDALDLIETLYACVSNFAYQQWGDYMTRDQIDQYIKDKEKYPDKDFDVARKIVDKEDE